jgi:hypothetical protein
MEIFSMTEISIPVIQMVLLLLLSTGALFFGKLKLALLMPIPVKSPCCSGASRHPIPG